MIAVEPETALQRMVRERRELVLDIARDYQVAFDISFAEAYMQAEQMLAEGRNR